MTDPINTALLPCPFCGKSETAIIEDPPPKPQWAFVKCVRCHCAGPTCGSRATAIKRWNTRGASHADTARQEGIALGLAMASKIVARAGHSLHVEIDCLAPIPPHVAAARVLLDDLRLVTAMVDWADANDFRLSQIQGFGYGADRLLFTVRDCWLNADQVVWQRQSSPAKKEEDHDEMMRQMEIYRLTLVMRAALEQIAGGADA